jgi:hypothetical protein
LARVYGLVFNICLYWSDFIPFNLHRSNRFKSDRFYEMNDKKSKFGLEWSVVKSRIIHFNLSPEELLRIYEESKRVNLNKTLHLKGLIMRIKHKLDYYGLLNEFKG